jgi:hypothetical protein
MHPALLRLQELETLHKLSQVAKARFYIGFEKHRSFEGTGGVMNESAIIG